MGGKHIEEDMLASLTVCFTSPADWAATFRLRGFNLVYASSMCDYTTGCDVYTFTTDGYGISNVRTRLGAYRTHERGEGVWGRHKQVCSRVDP